jgi:histone H1/5
MARKKPARKKTASKNKPTLKKKPAAKKLIKKKPVAKKKTAAKKTVAKKAAAKKPMAKKKAPAKKKSAGRKSASRQSSPIPISISSRRGLGPESGGQSGDTQGLSRRENVDSESVEELMEEGQYMEAEAVSGVENAPDADEGEVRTKQFSEDDVPEEYTDQD